MTVYVKSRLKKIKDSTAQLSDVTQRKRVLVITDIFTLTTMINLDNPQIEHRSATRYTSTAGVWKKVIIEIHLLQAVFVVTC